MAIAPPSDIVLEVARAADPERAAAVTRRLSSLGAESATATADFTAALSGTLPASAAPPRGVPDMRVRIGSKVDTETARAHKAEVQFEAVLLNSFVGEMLPKNAPEAYGQGLAGEMWRSLLAEKISNQIAGAGVLGLGQRLFATHPLSATSQLMHATHAARASAAQMSANALSMAGGAEMGDGNVLFANPAKS
jgi:flagellar protein FlgJ